MRGILYRSLIAACLFISSQTVVAQFALDAINQIRQQAGLIQFEHNQQLAQSAANHAAFLNRHYTQPLARSESMHSESASRSGFTGETVADRVTFTGYPHTQVLENVSMNDDSLSASLDGLMGAIYHRFTFLDLQSDEIGSASSGKSFVYNLGRLDLRNMCNAPGEDVLFRTPVYCLDTLVTADYYDKLCQTLPPQAMFDSPWHEACPSGQRLSADYMRRLCKNPPEAAKLKQGSSFYTICDGTLKVRSNWLNSFCQNPPAGAKYRLSGTYYTICGDQKVSKEWYQNRCNVVPAEGRYTDTGTYQQLCNNNQKVRVEYVNERQRQQQLQNPEIVLWPAPGMTDVPPAFYEEEPDPLPNQAVSGYPISIQVNPAYIQTVKLVSMELHRLSGDMWNKVKTLPIMKEKNDPNKRFTSHQFALFAKARLDWNRQYRVDAKLKLDNETRNLSWRFTTRNPGENLIQLNRNQNSTSINMNQDYLIYWPVPRRHQQLQTRISTRFRQGTKVDITIIDPDTVRIHVSGPYCDKVMINYSDGRRAELHIKGCS